MADTGTIFLDEIGDIPLDLQPKLLRVLQEQEFERLGSGKTHRVNVRVIAATHRNLMDMVAGEHFRSDLYYRLNVFPIELPPLRERRADIPRLVEHFVADLAARMRKDVHSVSARTMQQLLEFDWPGNVRELRTCSSAPSSSPRRPRSRSGLGTADVWRRQPTAGVHYWQGQRPRQRLPRSHPPRPRGHQLGHRRPLGVRATRHASGRPCLFV